MNDPARILWFFGFSFINMATVFGLAWLTKNTGITVPMLIIAILGLLLVAGIMQNLSPQGGYAYAVLGAFMPFLSILLVINSNAAEGVTVLVLSLSLLMVHKKSGGALNLINV